MTDFTKLTLSEVIAELESVSAGVKTRFGSLTAHQINWKPGAEQWSVGQCLDHLIVVNRKSLPVWEKAINGQQETSLWRKMPFVAGFLGRLIVNSQAPTSARKFKAPAIFHPSSSQIDSQVVAQFLEQQKEVLARINSAGGVNADRIIISSPVAKAIIFSLMDAFRLIAAHERRHLAQAARVMETPGFPS